MAEGRTEEGGDNWSTQWTQKPWSWSESWDGGMDGGKAGAGGDWRKVTEPWRDSTPSSPSDSPAVTPQQPKGRTSSSKEGKEGDAKTKEDSVEGDGSQQRREGLIQRFCSRHPDSPKCRATDGGAQKGTDGGGGLMERFCGRHPEHSKCHAGREEGEERSGSAQTTWQTTPSSDSELNGSQLRPAQMDQDVKPADPSISFGFLSEEAREAMLKSCRSSAVDCKAQPFGMMQKRTMVLQHEMDFMRKVRPYQSGDMIQKRVDLVQKLKQRLLEVAGLGEHVQPVNDGTFQHDVLLTEKQSEALIEALSKVPTSSKQNRYGYGHRFKRASLFLEQFAAQKWPVGQPISYFFDPKIEEFEKQMVRQAHQMIEAQTCIRFQPSDSKPASDFLYYIKVSTPTFCGLSYIGHVSPANPIYLSFQCQDPVGVAAHETMHALGANHEHLRADRDEHLDIQWANINPQFYDFFAIADPSKFTSYGSAYSYESIMHYGPFTATLDTSRPTMLPRENAEQNMALMGQRKRLSPRDAELLNNMYCKQGCEDRNVYCGIWTLRNFCRTPPQMGWMQQNCQKSCRFC
uniref:Metalloendopeptidase n=1 Tax=Globodera pallida TaxID=36090 RepID=A0A183CDJ0_GLOPA